MLCSGSTFAQEILTLEKALEIAYQQSPSIIQSKMSLEQSAGPDSAKSLVKITIQFEPEPVSIHQKHVV